MLFVIILIIIIAACCVGISNKVMGTPPPPVMTVRPAEPDDMFLEFSREAKQAGEAMQEFSGALQKTLIDLHNINLSHSVPVLEESPEIENGIATVPLLQDEIKVPQNNIMIGKIYNYRGKMYKLKSNPISAPISSCSLCAFDPSTCAFRFHEQPCVPNFHFSEIEYEVIKPKYRRIRL